MAYQTIFKRYELKYLLTKAQKEKVLQEIRPYMALDQYGRTTIRNIYFDTESYRLVRRSLEAPAYKEKLRIRSYCRAAPDSTVFVELKKKYQKVVYKRRIALPEQAAKPRRRAAHRRVDPPQHRYNLVPDAVARVNLVRIGAVGHITLTKLRQIGFHLRALHTDQRADDISPHRRDACQPFGAGAPRQMKQHGFQIVVRSMRGRNLPALRRSGQPLVSDTACHGFHALARRLGLRADVDPLDGQRHMQFLTQRTAERLVPVGLRTAQAVVQMERMHRIPERQQRAQQRDRIRAA